MFDQTDNQEISQLSQVNSELRASLKRCRVLLDDCRSKLAANSNEPDAANEEQAHEAAGD
jgi:hypothetical protein